MSNVLNEEKKQQVIALGRLGWSLRRIEEVTGVRRETASSYLKEAGVALRPARGRRVHSKPASPEKVTTDFGAESGGCIGTSTGAAAQSQSLGQRLRTLPRSD